MLDVLRQIRPETVRESFLGNKCWFMMARLDSQQLDEMIRVSREEHLESLPRAGSRLLEMCGGERIYSQCSGVQREDNPRVYFSHGKPDNGNFQVSFYVVS